MKFFTQTVGLSLLFVLTLATGTLAGNLCFEYAAQEYNVPVQDLIAIAKNESNFNQKARNENKNGSIDVGIMQINTFWKDKLGPQLWELLEQDACANIRIGAWVLADCYHRYGRNWKGLGCYNAVTPSKQAAYASRVIPNIHKLEAGHALD